MEGASPFIIRRVVFGGPGNAGERMPFLLHRDTKLPVTRPMEWALASRRGRGVAANTIERELGDVGLAEEWFRKEGLSLADPLAFVELFTPNRIEASLRPWLERDFSRRKVVKIAVGSSEIKMRLDTIGEYVDWVLRDAQSAFSVRTQPAQVLAFSRQRDTIAAALKDVTPSRSPAVDTEGLSDQQVHALLDLIDPRNTLCPWGRGNPSAVAAVRHRNQAIVLLMLSFGIRRGDLLKLCVGDVMTHSNEPFLQVRRRPDHPDDPRKYEPNAKTQERMLPLDRFLVRTLDDYVLKWRKTFPNAKRTPYPPYSCCVCDRYQPFTDSLNLHEQMLDHLLDRREAMRLDPLGMDRIAVQLDEVVYGCAQVIELIRGHDAHDKQ